MINSPKRIWAASDNQWFSREKHSFPVVEYIRADLAKPKVKPLVWNWFKHEQRWDSGNYTVDEDTDGMWRADEMSYAIGVYKTADQAKAAAQADYESRILSALVGG